MAKINRYDSPAESNYFNTFVPLPLDQITALGMKRQEDLERRQDTASKYIDQASLVDYIANSKDEQWVKNEYMPTLQKYAEEAMSVDLTNPVEWAKYSTKLRGVGTSETIRRIEESKGRWNQAQEMKQRLMAAGKYNQLLDEDPAAGWDSSTAVYNYMPEAYTDKAELFEQYYKHMQPRSKGVVTVDGVRVLREGIDSNDVRDISKRAAQELAATPQGQQQIKLFNKMYPEIAKGMSSVDILRTQMEDYGQQFIRSNDQVLPDKLQGGSGSTTDEGLFDLIPVSTSGKGFVLDPAGIDEGISKALSEIGNAAHPMTVVAGLSPGGFYDENATRASNDKMTKAYKDASSKIISKYPALAKGPNGETLSSQQIIDNYNLAVDEWKNTSSTVYSFGNKQVNDEWNRQVSTTLPHREIILPGKETPVSVKEAAKYYGYTYEEFAKALADEGDPSVHVNAPSINARGEGWSSLQVIPKNKKDVSREDILISSSKDETAYFKDYYKLQNSIKSDTPTPVILNEFNDGTGRKIVAIPMKSMGYNSVGKPSLDISIAEFLVDKNGKPIGGPISVDNQLDDYYTEAASSMIKGKHLDRDTKGLKLEY